MPGGESAPTGPFRTLVSGESSADDMVGWVVTSGDIDWINDYWRASNGQLSIDLNGSKAGTISQTIATVVGATYAVTFDLSGNPAGDPAVKTLTVSATGATPELFSYDTAAKGTTLEDMKWDERMYSFVATGTTTTLTFASSTTSNSGLFGPALDNVVITETLPTAANCKKDGWMDMEDSSGTPFKNQGDCVSFFATGGSNLGAG